MVHWKSIIYPSKMGGILFVATVCQVFHLKLNIYLDLMRIWWATQWRIHSIRNSPGMEWLFCLSCHAIREWYCLSWYAKVSYGVVFKLNQNSVLCSIWSAKYIHHCAISDVPWDSWELQQWIINYVCSRNFQLEYIK